MLNVISNAVATIFIKNGVADEEDRDIYIYSIGVLLYNIGTIIFILTLSLLFHNVTETIIFIMTFATLRRYTGGYHAKTRIRCFLTSVAVYIVAIIVETQLIDRGAIWILGLVLIFSVVILILFAPINSEKLIFSSERMYQLRGKARFYLGTLCCICAFLYYIGGIEYAIFISLGIISTSFSLMIEIMKRRREKNNEK